MNETKPKEDAFGPSEFTIRIPQEVPDSEKTESTTRNRPSLVVPSEAAFPEGGVRAWTVVLGAYVNSCPLTGVIFLLGGQLAASVHCLWVREMTEVHYYDPSNSMIVTRYVSTRLVNAYGVFNDFYVRNYLNNKTSSEIG